MDDKLENTDNKKSSSDEPNGDLKEDFEDLDELVSMVDEFSSYDDEEEVLPEYDDSFDRCQVCGSELINGECISCFEREARDREYLEGDELEHEDFREWRRDLKSKGELNLFGIFCVVVISIYIIYVSFPEVLSILTGDFILEHFVLYFVLLVLGLGALFGGFVMARHVIIYSRLFDTTFEKEIYSRLEPAFAEVGNIKGDLIEIHDKMERLNLTMKRLERETKTATQISSVSVHTSSALSYMALMFLTLGVFFFVLSFPDFYLTYAIGGLFLAWWAGITSDFKLWKVNVSWTWAFFAIVFVIPSTIFMSLIYGLSLVIGVMGIALALFAFSYYTWAKYYVEGTTLDILSSLGDEE